MYRRMIVSAHLLPHTPLLLPSVAKERMPLFAQTTDAVRQAARDIEQAKPDTIVVISSHGVMYSDAFSCNTHASYQAHFEEFGDFATRFTVRPDLETIDRVKRHFRTTGVPFTQTSEDSLDYGTAVTLSFLTPLLAKARILPLTPTQLDAKSHFEAGLHLSEVLLASNKRFSLICSADLSQRLTSQSPGGFSEHGQRFDDTLQQLLTSHNIAGLLKLKPEIIDEAGECAYRPLLILLGAIEAFPNQAEILSYESPFGVGELVVRFHLE